MSQHAAGFLVLVVFMVLVAVWALWETRGGGA